jgi:hypothetical protein
MVDVLHGRGVWYDHGNVCFLILSYGAIAKTPAQIKEAERLGVYAWW